MTDDQQHHGSEWPTVTSFLNPGNDMSISIPKIVYHYCSIEAFFNIIKSKQLYLSNTTSMNDYLENKCIKNSIEKFISKKYHMLNWLFLRRVQKLFSQYLEGGFITCFSQHKDMLSQWRGYAADGAGIAIGINSNILKPIKCDMENYNLTFGKIIYCENEQEKIINDLFHRYQNLIIFEEKNSVKKEKNSEWPKIIRPAEKVKIKQILQGNLNYNNKENIHINRCVSELLILSFFFKTSAFIEESEYRLCFFPNFTFLENSEKLIHPLSISSLNFRLSNNMIFPYHTLDFSNAANFFNEIVLGPKCKTPEKTIRNFLKCHDMGHIKIKKSTASYQ